MIDSCKVTGVISYAGQFRILTFPVPRCEHLQSESAVYMYLVAIGSYDGRLEAQRLCALCSRSHEETKLPRIRNYGTRYVQRSYENLEKFRQVEKKIKG